VEDVDQEEFRRHAWVTVNGVTTNSNSTDATFDMDISQYISATKDFEATQERPIFPLRANYDLTSARYKNKKPTVRDGRYVSLTGFLTRVLKSDSGDISRFVVDIDSVTHLGQAPPPTAPTSATPQSTSAPAQKPVRKLAFSFSQHGKSKRCKGKEPEAGPSESAA
jgi:hypothetical protein